MTATDPDEWRAGHDTVAGVHEAQSSEMRGQVEIKAGDIQTYVEGTVGWAANRAILRGKDH